MSPRLRRRQGDHRTRVLVALMMTMALIAMDTTIVATAIPQVVGDLGGFSLVGWVFSVYLLAQTVTIPVYGKLADLYGRKPILVVGTLVFLLGSALSAASWNMVSLICFRGLQGLGAVPPAELGAGDDPGVLVEPVALVGGGWAAVASQPGLEAPGAGR